MGQQVVVVGGGYGGAAVVKALESEADVVLVERRDSFVNTAASLRTLAQPAWAANMFFPFDTAFTRATVLRDRVVSADPDGVTLASGQRVAADYLVLATGTSYAYPAKPRADLRGEIVEHLLQTHKELSSAGRVLILGAGPEGLELAGEIKEVWPIKHVTIVDPASALLLGFLPPVREELHRQLKELAIDLKLGASLTAPLANEAGRVNTFTTTTTAGEEITADIWFRAYGVTTNSDYLADGRLTVLNGQGQVPVTDRLTVGQHDHVYAIGDLTDVAEAKMAGYAMQHAAVVTQNIRAQLRGEQPTATYQPLPHPMILLPLGTRGGVGQLPSPDGPMVAPTTTVIEFKGADLFTGRFVEQFGPTAS
jgi:NADH dehydrogenase FAD-containing subunit